LYITFNDIPFITYISTQDKIRAKEYLEANYVDEFSRQCAMVMEKKGKCNNFFLFSYDRLCLYTHIAIQK